MPDDRITGWEHRALRQALTAAFDTNELQMLVRESLDVKLPNIVNVDAPFDTVTFDLVGWADRQGLLLKLFESASESNPGNGTLRRAVAEVFHAGQRFEQLQSIVNFVVGGGGGFLDSAAWREAFAKAELAVCRIENAEGRPWGTGWLVSNDLILTNKHVWLEALNEGRLASTARAAFNYRILPTGGEAFAKRVAFAVNPVVSESAVANLDFALLRLGSAVGGTPVGTYLGAPTINPLHPNAYEFAGGEPAIIVQHPNGAPLKFAWGVIADKDAQNVPGRVAYRLNTEHGSSGAPVFLSDWRPVALHSQGNDTVSNAGVAMAEILPAIAPFLV